MLIEKDKVTNGIWNFHMLQDTVNTLRYSQGYYSRMAEYLDNIDEEEKANIISSLDCVNKFNDSVDVVMYLEG